MDGWIGYTASHHSLTQSINHIYNVA